MNLSKHPLVSAALLVWGASAAATPLLQDATRALVVSQDLLAAQAAGIASPPLAGKAQAPDDLGGRPGLLALGTFGPVSSATTPMAADSKSGPDLTGSPADAVPDNSAAGQVLGGMSAGMRVGNSAGISAAVWAQIAALATAACAALGLLLLKRNATRSATALTTARTTPSSPAGQAVQAKADLKRRRVAYRL